MSMLNRDSLIVSSPAPPRSWWVGGGGGLSSCVELKHELVTPWPSLLIMSSPSPPSMTSLPLQPTSTSLPPSP
jgi:hypothetical protein